MYTQKSLVYYCFFQILPIEQNVNGSVAILQATDTVTEVVVTLKPNPNIDLIPQSPILNRKRHENEVQERVTKTMRKHYNALGSMSIHEWSIVICFSTLICLWFFRQPMFIYGWGDSLKRMTDRGQIAAVADASPAMLMVIMVFVLPIHYKFWPFQSMGTDPKNSPSLVTWKIVEKKMPWGVLLFLGGGFALSDACTKTGLNLNKIFLS